MKTFKRLVLPLRGSISTPDEMVLLKTMLLPCIALLLVASPAAATFYHWTGAVDTNYFEPGNWSKGSDPDPYPRGGDSPRFGVQANNFPATWCHYNGTNTAGGVTPADGVFQIGGVTNAWFFMEGGHLVHNSFVNIGQTAPFVGHWVHNGGIFDSSPWVRQFTVAANTDGDLVISGGAILVDNFAVLRNSAAAGVTTAWALLTGTGHIGCNTAFIGIYGTAATLTNRENALFSITNTLTLGRNEGGIGRMYQEGGTVVCGLSSDIGLNIYTLGSEYMLSGGTLITRSIDSSFTNDGGAFVFDGGTLKAQGSSQRLIRHIGRVVIQTGKTAFIDTGDFYERVQTGITGEGGLTKLGTGTLVLEGTNSYAGPTLVSAGTVLFGANQALTAVSVAGSATLGTDIDQPDNQAVLSSLTLEANSQVLFHLRPGDLKPAPARMAAGSLVLNGAATLNIATPELIAPGTYSLLSYGSLSGGGTLALGPLPCGMVANLVTNGSVLELVVAQGASAPQIASPPASQTVLENRSVTFAVTLSECAELAGYQWVYNETNLIAGATTSTYLIAQAQLADAGTYRVIVSNNIGSVTSAPAVLTVTADTVPPLPVSAVRPYGLATNVIVTFDEALDPVSATAALNYTLSNITAGASLGSPQTAAQLGPQAVRLTFPAPLAEDTVYKLTVAGVKDLAMTSQPGASLLVSLLGVVQPVGPIRLGVMEAEEAEETVASAAYDGTLRNWEIAADRPGYSGWAALQCQPNVGHTGNPTGPEGPAARFTVEFPADDTYPVTYYLSIRGAGATAEDDSCHATLDWQYPNPVLAPSLSQNLYQPNGGYGWVNRSSQGGFGRAMLVVSNAGIHTVDVLMREDGFYVDKLVISTDSLYDPSTINGGLGPDTVTRRVYPAPIAFLPGTASLAGGQFKVNLQTTAAVQNIVEYKDKLGDANWSLLSAFTGSGAIQSITDPAPSPNGRIYRARIVVP